MILVLLFDAMFLKELACFRLPKHQAAGLAAAQVRAGRRQLMQERQIGGTSASQALTGLAGHFAFCGAWNVAV
jgi:hypothetical protein